jgi:hypothetical protein
MAEPLTFVSLGIGAWGATIATGLAVLQERRRERRTLNVTCHVGYMPGTGQRAIAVISVFAVNEGHRPIEVSGVSFRLEDGYDVLVVPEIGKPKLPVLLGDGQSVVTHYDKATLDGIEKEGRRVVWAVVWDASRTECTAPYPPPE